MVGGEALLRAILQVVDEGIHVIDTQGVTVFYNEAAAKQEGLDPAEVVGHHLLAVFPSLTEETSTLLKVLHTRTPILNEQQTFTNYKGHRVTTVNSSYPLVVEGQLVGALEVSKDITRVRELAEAVQDLRAALLRKGRSPGTGPGTARFRFDDLVGEDPAFRRVVEQARRAAQGSTPILVGGETGTGKELLVQAVHNASPRAGRPLIAQNCAALPEGLLEGILFGTARGGFTGAEDRPGLFELADGGTLFLDEINSMPLGLQAKLLRALQDGRVRRVGEARERAVDVRILAAVGEDPLVAVEEGRLRRDLFYRINVVYLELPPLRHRRGDIPRLCEHFLAKHQRKAGGPVHGEPVQGIAPEVLAFFQRYPWPGNVRELENAIEGALALARGKRITLGDLPEPLQRAAQSLDLPAQSLDLPAQSLDLPAQDPGSTDQPEPARGQAAGPSVPGSALMGPTDQGSSPMESSGQRSTPPGAPAQEPAAPGNREPGPPIGDLRTTLARAEREAILAALAATGGRVAPAARLLGLPRQTLQYRMRVLGIRGSRPGEAGGSEDPQGPGRPEPASGPGGQAERAPGG